MRMYSSTHSFLGLCQRYQAIPYCRLIKAGQSLSANAELALLYHSERRKDGMTRRGGTRLLSGDRSAKVERVGELVRQPERLSGVTKNPPIIGTTISMY